MFDRAHAAEINASSLPPEQGLSELRSIDSHGDLVERSAIKFADLVKSQNTKDGEIHRFGITTEAGYSYAGMVGFSSQRSCDVPVVGTSAWLTSSEGHNEHTVRNLMRTGNDVIFLAAEGSWRPGRLRLPDAPITLAGSASAVMNFSRFAADVYSDRIVSNHRAAIGDSRAAMVGMGMIALDSIFGQEILLADYIAPCFPRRPRLGDVAVLASQLVQEPISTAKFINGLTFSKLIHYPSTIDVHPYSLLHQASMIPALLSGETGDLARMVVNKALIHLTYFVGDKASMKSEWEDIFKGDDGVHIVPLEGSHLSLADPETLAYILARNKFFQQVYNTEGKEGLSRESVFVPAHKHVDDMLGRGLDRPRD